MRKDDLAIVLALLLLVIALPIAIILGIDTRIRLRALEEWRETMGAAAMQNDAAQRPSALTPSAAPALTGKEVMPNARSELRSPGSLDVGPPRPAAEPKEPRRGYSSTHDFMLDRFPDVRDHKHGEDECNFHVAGRRFWFKWDGERWEQTRAERED